MTEKPKSSGLLFLILTTLACAVASAILLAPGLASGASINGRDTVTHDFGMLLFAWSVVGETGRIPLWNPYLFGGIPMLGSFAFCPFYPSSVLFAGLAFPLAFTLQYLFAFTVGGVGMGVLIRRLGLGWAPALAGALVFSLSGHFTSLAHAGHMTKVLAFACVPWLFAAAEHWFEHKSWRRAALIAIPFCFMLTASHFQIAYLAGLFLCLWFVWRSIEEKAWRCPARLLINAAQLGAAVCLATILSAAQVLPGLEMAPLSNRTEGVSYEEAARTSYPPEELLEYVAPGAFGVNLPNEDTYRGRWGERVVTDYFGVGAMVLAFCGITFSSRRKRWFWAALLLSGIAIGTGASTGLLKLLRAILPGFMSFRSPAVAMGWTTIGGIVLMSMGLDWLLSPHERKARWIGTISFFSLGLAAGLSGYFFGADYFHDPSLRSPVGAALRTCGFLMFQLPLAGVMMWASRRELGEKGETQDSPIFTTLSRKDYVAVFAVAWIIVLSVEVGEYSRNFMTPLDLSGFYGFLESSTPSNVSMDSDHPVRIVHKGNELSNAFMAVGVGSIHGYHPIVYDRYVKTIDRFGFESRETSNLFHQNWLIAPAGHALENKDVWNAVRTIPRGILYHRSQPAPYIRFPENAKIVSGREEAFEALAGKNPFDGNAAIVESEIDSPTRQANAGLPQTRLLRYTSDAVGFSADVGSQPALAVFGDLMAPGWKLWRVGEARERLEEIETYYANGAFRSALLPAGSSEYLWKYEPMSFRLGVFVSLIGWTGLWIAFLTGWRKRRQGSVD